MYQLLSKIESPADLKHLTRDELKQVARELRQAIIDNLSNTGGHFASDLGATDLIVPSAVMVNLIAGRTHPAELETLGADAHARIHRYGKTSRPGRKIGHVTFCGADRPALLRQATTLCQPAPMEVRS